MWANTVDGWMYTGNQYVMQELFTIEQCNEIVAKTNWQKYEENEYYGLQFDCFEKDDR
jgi:hypothetical protein